MAENIADMHYNYDYDNDKKQDKKSVFLKDRFLDLLDLRISQEKLCSK